MDCRPDDRGAREERLLGTQLEEMPFQRVTRREIELPKERPQRGLRIEAAYF
jgi:hypothetical protein